MKDFKQIIDNKKDQENDTNRASLSLIISTATR